MAPTAMDTAGVPGTAPGFRPTRVPRPVRNVMSNWGAFLFSAVANFFLAPFIVHSLGNATYGAWVLLGSLVGYLGLLDLGVRGAIMRFVARLHARGEHDEASSFASAGLLVFSISSVITLAAGVGLALGIHRWFEIPPELLAESRVAVVLIAVTIVFALMTGVYGGIITAMQRFDLSSAAEMSIEAVRIVAVVVVLRAGEGLVALAMIQLGCGILRFAVSFILSRRLYPELRVVTGRWTRSHMRQIFGYSIASTALHGAAVVTLQLDAVVIGAFLPVSMVAFFAIAGTLAHYGRAVVDGITHIVPPRVSAQEGRGDLEGARTTALLGGKVATLVHLPIIATFLIRGDTFIGLWMGAEYAQLSGHVLWVLSLAYWFIAGRQTMVTTLMGLNRHHVLVPAAWTEAIINVTLSVLWVGSYGIVGVAWGTTVPSLVFTIALYPLLFGKVLQIPFTRVWREIWLRPSLAVIPFMVASYLIERLWLSDSLFIFFLQVAAALPAAAAGAWWLALGPGERAAVRVRVPALKRARLAASAEQG